MIDKLAGYKTQIRVLERKLKELDHTKLSPSKVNEITDAIKNLKEIVKEKEQKREERRKGKEQTAQEVEKEAINIPSATEVGAVSQNAPAPADANGAPAATPSTTPNQNQSCPLCGGLTFPDAAAYQQHMQYTHASDIMPTGPGQKEDKLVASVETESANKCAICGIQFNSFPEYESHQAEKHSGNPVKEMVEAEGPKFKLDDEVRPIRGGDSIGKVMRWDGKDNDHVYVMWESGPLKDRDGFGGYYKDDLESAQEEKPVKAAIEPEPACEECAGIRTIHGDLKGNYEALLKDLKEERDIHYTSGNSKWVERLDQKIRDLEKSIEDKFGDIETKSCSACGQKKESAPAFKCDNCGAPMSPTDQSHLENLPNGDQKWTCSKKEAGHENGSGATERLTIVDHSPAGFADMTDSGEGKDELNSEFESEWAEPVIASTKLNVFKRELLATPLNDGYDISQSGKKLFHIKGKDSKPMSKEQIEFCAQIELTRGLKQAKLTEKIAFLNAGTKVYILAQDRAGKRVKFACMEQGLRGWAPITKFAFQAKEGEMRKHRDHIDNTYGHNGKEILVDCPNGSGNLVWLPINELLPIEAPPATPESLNPDLGAESAQVEKPSHKCPSCGKSTYFESAKGWRPFCSQECAGKGTATKESAKECPDCHGNFEGAEGATCPTCGRFAVQKEALRPALPPQILNRRQEVNASGCDQCDAAMINGVFCHETGCPNQHKEWEQEQEFGNFLESSLNKIAHIRHEDGKWVVYSHDYKKKLGTYLTKAEAVHRLKSIEYWKSHKGSIIKSPDGKTYKIGTCDFDTDMVNLDEIK